MIKRKKKVKVFKETTQDGLKSEMKDENSEEMETSQELEEEDQGKDLSNADEGQTENENTMPLKVSQNNSD